MTNQQPTEEYLRILDKLADSALAMMQMILSLQQRVDVLDQALRSQHNRIAALERTQAEREGEL